MKQYRLLRNNKECGPYSAEELIQTGFKPYDLIWIDGKSAAWRYPGEMEEFKLYAPAIEEQPFDRFYKKPLATESKKEIINPPVITTSSINAIPSVAVKPEKPRIRIKADSRKIETPIASATIIQKEKIKPAIQEERIRPSLQKETIKPALQKETIQPAERIETEKPEQTELTHPGWKDIWLDWEQEKKAVSAATKTSIREQSQPKEALETKFSQSLDEIKERYAETVLKPQKNPPAGKYSNYITALVLTVAILGFGMWMGINWSKKSNATTEQKIANTQPEKTFPQNKETEKQPLVVEKNEDKTSDASSKVNTANNANEPITHSIKTTSGTKKSQLFHPSNKLTENKSTYEPKQKQPVKNSPYKNEPGDVAALNKNASENIVSKNNDTTPLSKVQDNPGGFTHFKQQPKINDFIAVDTYTPSPVSAVGVKLHVQNISDIPVDMTMIDLQYYDASGRYQMGATIYVRNIAAGQAVTVAAPDNSHATKLGYRISMVSSEKNNMYLIAD